MTTAWGSAPLVSSETAGNEPLSSSLQVFLENVQHEDSFVYLSAIQGEQCLT